MAVIYCHELDQMIDLDNDIEHIEECDSCMKDFHTPEEVMAIKLNRAIEDGCLCKLCNRNFVELVSSDGLICGTCQGLIEKGWEHKIERDNEKT